MIEVVYKEEKSEEKKESGFRLPRNIRQIGLIRENYRIYMEDYVYTFLGKTAAAAAKMECLGLAGILTGEVQWKDRVTYVFIHGAALMEKTEAAYDHFSPEEETWDRLETECKTYFPNQEIVGWFLAQQGIPICATEILTRAHIKYFGGEKVLFLMEPMEKEDAFFRFENNFLIKQSGYYLYYEKNEGMQNYMLAKNQVLEAESKEKTQDQAVRDFRRIIQEKNEKKEDNSPFLSYAAVACLVLMTGAVGVRFYRNYQELQKYEIVQEVEPAGSFDVHPVISEKESANPSPGLIKKMDSVQTQDPVKEEKTQKPEPTKITPTPVERSQEKKTVTPKTEQAEKQISKKEKTVETNGKMNSTVTGKGYRYIVRPGDSLFQISLDHYGTIDRIPEICEVNGLSEEEMIYAGQIIVLP